MNLKELEARKVEFEKGVMEAQKQIEEHKNAINNLSARVIATKGALEDIQYWIANLQKKEESVKEQGQGHRHFTESIPGLTGLPKKRRK